MPRFRERRAAGEQRRRRPHRLPAAAVDEGDRWVIHSAGNEETLPGAVVRSEGDAAVDDLAVDEAYAWTQQVWDLYEQQFDRRSFDGAGSTVTVTVHYGQNYDNAFWDGEQLVFGDGDGEIFERFTKPADVLAHEFSHGVVQYTSAFTLLRSVRAPSTRASPTCSPRCRSSTPPGRPPTRPAG